MNLAIDFDGTLVRWDHKDPGDWTFEWYVGDDPEGIDGKSVLRFFIDQGHEVVIHTCRATWEAAQNHEPMSRWLADEGFCPHIVTARTKNDGYQEQVWEQVFPERKLHLAGARPVGIWKGIGKPVANWYIDDRGINFDGDWRKVIGEVMRRGT